MDFDKRVDKVFKLINNRYPYLVDVDYKMYYNDEQILFTFYIDLIKIKKSFPKYTLDIEWIKNMKPGNSAFSNPTTLFTQYLEDEILENEGERVVEFMDGLLKTIVRYDIDIYIDFKFTFN